MSAGTIQFLKHESKVLKNNPLGDPHERTIAVYLPRNSKLEASQPMVALLALVGFGSTGPAMFNVDPFAEPLNERMDRLIAAGMPPCLIVAPDCFNSFGGSQYINSPAIGDYQRYLVDEVMPMVELHFNVTRWGVFGKSSGGFGALNLIMDYPERFDGVACHAGDNNFELCYLPDFPKALAAYRNAGGVAKWFKAYRQDINRKRSRYFAPLATLAMAAHYSPNSKHELGIELPFNVESGVFYPEVWQRWREWDPMNRIDKHIQAFQSQRLVFLDCGRHDEHSLHLGTEAIAKRLEPHGVNVTCELFDDGHRSTTYRYSHSLPKLVEALSN